LIGNGMSKKSLDPLNIFGSGNQSLNSAEDREKNMQQVKNLYNLATVKRDQQTDPPIRRSERFLRSGCRLSFAG